MTLLVTQVMAFPSWLSARTPFPPVLRGAPLPWPDVPTAKPCPVCLSLPTAGTHSFPCLSESCPLSRLLLPLTHCPDRQRQSRAREVISVLCADHTESRPGLLFWAWCCREDVQVERLVWGLDRKHSVHRAASAGCSLEGGARSDTEGRSQGCLWGCWRGVG